MSDIKGFITNLGKYNEGELIGEWLGLPCDEDKIQQVFDRIGINEEYEEYFITDYESEFGMKLSEYENIIELNKQMLELENYIDNDRDIHKAKAMMSELGYDFQEVIDNWNGYDFMEGWTAEEYEQDIVENCYDVDKLTDGWLSNYITIDYEAMARDDDGIWETEDGVLYEV